MNEPISINETELDQEQFTISNWWRLYHGTTPLSRGELTSMGHRAGKYCRENGVERGEIPSKRFGTSHAYPKWLLDNLFAEKVVARNGC